MKDEDYELFRELGVKITSKTLEFTDANLWLDDFSPEKISFVSSVLEIQKCAKISSLNIFASVEVCQILESKFTKQAFLPCRFFHEISLGKLKVELLPSGESLGSAALYIRYPNKNLLFISEWSLQNSSALRNFSVKEADYLIIKLSNNYKNDNVAENTELVRLVAMAKTLVEVEENLIVLTSANGDAQRIAEACIDVGLNVFCSEKFLHTLKSVDKSISLETIPPWLNKIEALDSFEKLPTKGVVLLSKFNKNKIFPAGIWVKTQNSLELTGDNENITVSDNFDLSVKLSNADYLKLCNKVKAKKVYVYGQNADNLCKYLSEQKIVAREIPLLRENSIFG